MEKGQNVGIKSAIAPIFKGQSLVTNFDVANDYNS